MTTVELINDIRIKVDDFEWKVTPKLATDLDGIKFLTINPRDYGLTKVI